MRILFTVLLLLSFVKADEMNRIDSIVSDIAKLRTQYDECKKELNFKNTPFAKNYKSLYEKEKEKNTILEKKIKKLEKELLSRKKLLKTKCKTVKKLVKNQDNFPKLMMKQKINHKKDDLVRFKATVYRLKYDSIIYDDINGKMITKWSEKTSFTSSAKTSRWIKVSGYFVNKKWRAAKKDMWIKIRQVEKK